MYEALYYGGFTFAGIMLLVSVCLLIRFRIFKIIRSLSGYSGKKPEKQGIVRQTTPLEAVEAGECTTKLEQEYVEASPEFTIISEITRIHTDEVI